MTSGSNSALIMRQYNINVNINEAYIISAMCSALVYRMRNQWRIMKLVCNVYAVNNQYAMLAYVS